MVFALTGTLVFDRGSWAFWSQKAFMLLKMIPIWIRSAYFHHIRR